MAENSYSEFHAQQQSENNEMNRIKVNSEDGRLFLRKSINGVRYVKFWGRKGDPEDEAYMSLVAAKASREIQLGTFQGFDKWFKNIKTWNRAALIADVHQLSATNNTTAILKHLREFPREIRTRDECLYFMESLPVVAATKARYLSILKQVAPTLCENITYTGSKGRPDPFQSDEIARMFDVLKSQQDKPLELLIKFWLATGLRTGEMAALSLDWVHPLNTDMTVKGSYHVPSRRIKECKSGQGRIIPVSPNLSEVLDEMLMVRPGYYPFTELRYTGNFVSRKWQPLLLEAQVRYRRPYTLRHTCASNKIVEYRGDLARVAHEMGHSIDVLTKHYAGIIHQVSR